jgi:hypothetical protein
MTAVDGCVNADGNLYYLPGPMDVYGIVYDKTMFEEKGWEVPHSYSEFVALIKQIREEGTVSGESVEPIQISLMYPDMFQILFNTFGYLDAYGGKDNYIWLTEYQQGNGSMVGHMESAVKDFRNLFTDGILSVSDLEVTPSQRSQMMYIEHSTAMIVECQNAVNYAVTMNAASEDAGELHEIGMMPFWVSDEENSDFLYTIPSYYMAINKASAQESSSKKQILLDIFGYLSSVEGQEMLIGDNFQISNIEGVPIQSNEFSKEIIDTVARGQIINTFYLAEGETDKQVERKMLANVGDLILGNISTEEWLLLADETRDDYLSGNLGNEEVYGQVESTMTRLETAYTMAQMYASLMDVPIGICRGGGWDRSTNGYLYEGDITDSSLSCITPNKESTSEDPDADRIVSASLTGQQILDILNGSKELNTTKGFSTYFVAYGLEVEFAPCAEDGNRVISCKLPDGTDLDPAEVYEVAYFNGSLPDIGAEPEHVLEQSWQDAFLTWLEEEGGVLQKPKMTLKLVYEE